ncbi:hypothetical protein GCM10007063_34140 [Lentibacillus kapialis]|uniref:Uncharacterized protein n=1 Tax=Lentibacillus kapialis TaxID=340214 RepID=A0A917Q334_9BACI|nr:hypothetical protein GCM10007063_34140 [Lentibacillus kapialis]
MTQTLEQLQQQLRSLRLSESAQHLPALVQQAESEDGCFCPTPRKGIFQNIKIYLSYHR